MKLAALIFLPADGSARNISSSTERMHTQNDGIFKSINISMKYKLYSIVIRKQD